MKWGMVFISVLLILVTGAALAGVAPRPVERVPARNLPLPGEIEEARGPLPFLPSRPPSAGSLDSVGTAYVAGETYWDLQHNGSVGRMIATDTTGYVHMVWRKSEDNQNNTRNVYYNVWNTATQSFVVMAGSDQGVAINSSPLAGYITLAVSPDGWPYPAYHERLNGETTLHASGAMDFQRYFGAFISSQPNRCMEAGAPIQIVWPKVAVSPSGTVHLASMETPYSEDLGHWQRLYYSRGTPVFMGTQGLGIEWDQLGCEGFLQIDTAMVIAQVVAASKTSERVAIVWSHSRDNLSDSANRTQYNNDLYYKLSEDGGLNWGENVNLTHFIPPLDTFPQVWDSTLQEWVNDTLTANQDTNRVYTDCDALFDLNDNLHIAFTTANFYSWEETISRFNSDIWHWSEGMPDEIGHVAGMRFRPVQDTLIETCWPLGGDWDIGPWQRMTQRPSLACDWQTGIMYCAYQWYDPLQVTTEGNPMADILLAVSRDGGHSWTDSVNVTNTGEPVDSMCHQAQVGEAQSERDMSLAEQVAYTNGEGYLHMFYELDTGCGEDVGAHTLNYAIYRRIPVASIPERPIHDPRYIPLHVDYLQFPAGVDQPHVTRPPAAFTLYPSYPNPFNPIAHIQFDLARNTRVSLKVYNVMGQEVAALYDGVFLNAGTQRVTFDASKLGSGVYFYRLEAGDFSQSRKMVLLK